MLPGQLRRDRYEMYGSKAEELYTDELGWADFLADGGTVAIWIEDGWDYRVKSS